MSCHMLPILHFPLGVCTLSFSSLNASLQPRSPHTITRTWFLVETLQSLFLQKNFHLGHCICSQELRHVSRRDDLEGLFHREMNVLGNEQNEALQKTQQLRFHRRYCVYSLFRNLQLNSPLFVHAEFLMEWMTLRRDWQLRRCS